MQSCKKVLILNNPSSLLVLFTKLADEIREIWVEKGASPEVDLMMERACVFLRLHEDYQIRVFSVPSLFSAAEENYAKKALYYRNISHETTAICKREGVDEIVCTTTSSFRLAKIRSLDVVDHGTGDYGRTVPMVLAERMKYSYLYSSATKRNFNYHSLLPLPGRAHLELERKRMIARLGYCDSPFSTEKSSIILLVYPLVSLSLQLDRLAELKKNESFDLFLKGHHFAKSYHRSKQSVEPKSNSKTLPEGFNSLPAELLVLGTESSVSIAAFESSALWNLGYIDKSLVTTLAFREEVCALSNTWPASLNVIENYLSYSPYVSKGNHL